MMKDDTSNRKYNSLSKRNEKLGFYIKYLECNPSPDFIKKEVERLSLIIKNKMSQYDYWSSNNCPKDLEVKKRKALFNRELGLTKMRKQIKDLNHILS